MKKQQRDDKLDIMRARFIRLPAITAVFLLILLSGSCNALKRGDFLRQADDTLYFSQIGFLMADNPDLTRNAVTYVKGFDNDLWITVPYSADTTSPLIINFNVVGKDTIVEYENPPGIWNTAVSGQTPLIFNDGLLPGTPLSHNLRISKPSIDGGPGNTRVFTVNVDKIIRPVLLNPPAKDIAGPFTIATGNPFIISFVDEDGNPILNMNSGTWNIDQMYFQWDDWRLQITNLLPTPPPLPPPYLAAPYTAGPLEGYELDVIPLYPGEHIVQVSQNQYTDINGYISIFNEISFNYSPPPVYLSQSGNDSNSGLSPSTPVKTWTKARSVASTSGIFDMYIEASDTHYDVNGTISGIIDNTAILNIYGGYKPGFDGQYDNEWDSRPNTILFNSAQLAGGGELSPSFVLQYDGVSNFFVMDKVQLEAAPNTLFSSALNMVNNAQPLLNDVTLIASQGAGDSSGLTLINSSPIVRESRIIGKNGGTGKSVGIRMDNSNLQLESCFILSGDLTGNAYGISASGAVSSSITTWEVVIQSGIIINDNYIETENFGIIASDTFLDLNNTWIHAKKSSLKSVAVQSSHPAIALDTNILGATFIADSSPSPIGLNITSTAAGSNFHMYNSVVLTDKASAGSTGEVLGVNLQNMGFARISSNAIRVGTGDGADKTIGINLDGSSNLQLHNNFIWSHQASDFLGIRSDVDVSSTGSDIPIRHNDFWDANGAVELELISGSQDSIYNWQNPASNVIGNISLPVSIDTTYNYDTDELDVGRITGTLFDDVVYGGEDIMGLLPVSYDRDGPDPDGRERTPDFGVGLSIGPYEYGNDGFLPREIYVSVATDGGDDNHPIGSRQNPFETIQQAYNYLSATDPLGMSTIRVSEGSYTTTAALTLDKDFKLLGGYSPSFTSRNVNTYPSIITTVASTMFNITGNNVTRTFLLEGFTLKTSNGGSTTILALDGSASPVIRNNRIIGGSGNSSKGIDIIDESNPKIVANHIFVGTNVDSSHGIFIQEAGAEIFNNVIHSGTATKLLGGYTAGIEFVDNDTSPNFNPVYVYNNTIFGGNGGSISSGIRSHDDNIHVVNNLLIAGSVLSGSAFGYQIGGSSPPFKVSNNLFLFGPLDPSRHAIDILGSIWDTVTDMENDLTATYGRTASGNRMDGTSLPSAYFVNFVPAMTEGGFLAENWKLNATGPQNARTGGQDLSGSFNKDKDGKTRTAPWSIGAYEY